jgi:hypothetical protein
MSVEKRKESDGAGMLFEAPPPSRAENFQTLYINSSKFGFSAYDFRITIGRTFGTGNSQVNQDLAELLMSPQHAKSFFQLLGDAIDKYEAQFGAVVDVRQLVEAQRAKSK